MKLSGSRAEEPPSHGRSLVAFYVTTGAATLLFLMGIWLWVPASVWYWEREVRVAYKGEKILAARRLASMGPVAFAAFRRLLRNEDPLVQDAALWGLDSRECGWAFPLIIEAAQSPDASVALSAILLAERLASRSFGARDSPQDLPGSRDRLLNWWEQEGKTEFPSDPRTDSGGTVKRPQ
jgi:hypothetical protein